MAKWWRKLSKPPGTYPEWRGGDGVLPRKDSITFKPGSVEGPGGQANKNCTHPCEIVEGAQVLSRDCVGGTPGVKHVEHGGAGAGQRTGISVASLHGLELFARNRCRSRFLFTCT